MQETDESPNVNEGDTPMVVFSELNQQGQNLSAENSNQDCDEDCESFFPIDLMSFAWQIARGMVSCHSYAHGVAVEL